jgi:hypothetical protein
MRRVALAGLLSCGAFGESGGTADAGDRVDDGSALGDDAGAALCERYAAPLLCDDFERGLTWLKEIDDSTNSSIDIMERSDAPSPSHAFHATVSPTSSSVDCKGTRLTAGQVNTTKFEAWIRLSQTGTGDGVLLQIKANSDYPRLRLHADGSVEEEVSDSVQQIKAIVEPRWKSGWSKVVISFVSGKPISVTVDHVLTQLPTADASWMPALHEIEIGLDDVGGPTTWKVEFDSVLVIDD